MYLRYTSKYYNAKTQKIELGFFWAADYLQKNGTLSNDSQKQLDELIYWFDHQLPIPEYYQKEKNRQANKSATSWFKDSAKIYISKMNEIAEILKENHIEVNRISSKTLVGKVIYEDEFQVTIVPFREIKKQVV